MEQGQLWSQLGLETEKRVLIIEDHRSFAAALRDVLIAEGHEVTCFAGVEQCDSQSLLGVDPNASVELEDFDVCFLDHYFEGGFFNGTTMTPLLVGAGITVCGMSSLASANRSMIASGAVTALIKLQLGELLDIK